MVQRVKRVRLVDLQSRSVASIWGKPRSAHATVGVLRTFSPTKDPNIALHARAKYVSTMGLGLRTGVDSTISQNDPVPIRNASANL